MSSAFMVRGIGEKGGKYMKNKIKYADEPMGELGVIKDFLPPPDQLVLKQENVKITISLKRGKALGTLFAILLSHLIGVY